MKLKWYSPRYSNLQRSRNKQKLPVFEANVLPLSKTGAHWGISYMASMNNIEKAKCFQMCVVFLWPFIKGVCQNKMQRRHPSSCSCAHSWGRSSLTCKYSQKSMNPRLNAQRENLSSCHMVRMQCPRAGAEVSNCVKLISLHVMFSPNHLIIQAWGREALVIV